MRNLARKGVEQKAQQKDWVKKLDVNNEHDGWEGYLIANDAEQSEIGKNTDMIVIFAHGM